MELNTIFFWASAS